MIGEDAGSADAGDAHGAQSGAARPVVIIGAGLAGLACALHLRDAGREVVVLEASDGVGGRARTDVVDGCLIDRGFQVLLTAYPEAYRTLDPRALGLREFRPGALVRWGGTFHRVSDPWRDPLGALGTAAAPIGTLGDKLALARLRSRLRKRPVEHCWQAPDRPTIDHLRAEGFSPTMIERFWRPFLGGVFLDPALQTSARMFEFVFMMFAEGYAALPAGGIGAIAAHLAGKLPKGTVRLGQRVSALRRRIKAMGPEGWMDPRDWSVEVGGWPSMTGARVVVATEADEARALLGSRGELRQVRWTSVVTLSFLAERPPLSEAVLVLNGEGESSGPVNHLHVAEQVQPSYAPKGGGSLVVASVVHERYTAPGRSVRQRLLESGEEFHARQDAARAADAALEGQCRAQLAGWFPRANVPGWRLLRQERTERALPAQGPGWLEPALREVRLGDGLYVCGDWLASASIDGALRSGRAAAEAVLEDERAGA